MATIIEDISRTFAEYLLLPRLTPRDLRTDSIRVAAPLTSDGRFQINIPVARPVCRQYRAPGFLFRSHGKAG